MRTTIVKCVCLILLVLVDVDLGHATKKPNKKGGPHRKKLHHHHSGHTLKTHASDQQNVLTNIGSVTHDEHANSSTIQLVPNQQSEKHRVRFAVGLSNDTNIMQLIGNLSNVKATDPSSLSPEFLKSIYEHAKVKPGDPKPIIKIIREPGNGNEQHHVLHFVTYVNKTIVQGTNPTPQIQSVPSIKNTIIQHTLPVKIIVPSGRPVPQPGIKILPRSDNVISIVQHPVEPNNLNSKGGTQNQIFQTPKRSTRTDSKPDNVPPIVKPSPNNVESPLLVRSSTSRPNLPTLSTLTPPSAIKSGSLGSLDSLGSTASLGSPGSVQQLPKQQSPQVGQARSPSSQDTSRLHPPGTTAGPTQSSSSLLGSIVSPTRSPIPQGPSEVLQQPTTPGNPPSRSSSPQGPSGVSQIPTGSIQPKPTPPSISLEGSKGSLGSQNQSEGSSRSPLDSSRGSASPNASDSLQPPDLRGSTFNWRHYMIAFTNSDMCLQYPYRCKEYSHILEMKRAYDGYSDSETGKIRDNYRGNTMFRNFVSDQGKTSGVMDTHNFAFNNMDGSTTSYRSFKPNPIKLNPPVPSYPIEPNLPTGSSPVRPVGYFYSSQNPPHVPPPNFIKTLFRNLKIDRPHQITGPEDAFSSEPWKGQKIFGFGNYQKDSHAYSSRHAYAHNYPRSSQYPLYDQYNTKNSHYMSNYPRYHHQLDNLYYSKLLKQKTDSPRRDNYNRPFVNEYPYYPPILNSEPYKKDSNYLGHDTISDSSPSLNFLYPYPYYDSSYNRYANPVLRTYLKKENRYPFFTTSDEQQTKQLHKLNRLQRKQYLTTGDEEVSKAINSFIHNGYDVDDSSSDYHPLKRFHHEQSKELNFQKSQSHNYPSRFYSFYPATDPEPFFEHENSPLLASSKYYNFNPVKTQSYNKFYNDINPEYDFDERNRDPYNY